MSSTSTQLFVAQGRPIQFGLAALRSAPKVYAHVRATVLCHGGTVTDSGRHTLHCRTLYLDLRSPGTDSHHHQQQQQLQLPNTYHYSYVDQCVQRQFVLDPRPFCVQRQCTVVPATAGGGKGGGGGGGAETTVNALKVLLMGWSWARLYRAEKTPNAPAPSVPAPTAPVPTAPAPIAPVPSAPAPIAPAPIAPVPSALSGLVLNRARASDRRCRDLITTTPATATITTATFSTATTTAANYSTITTATFSTATTTAATAAEGRRLRPHHRRPGTTGRSNCGGTGRLTSRDASDRLYPALALVTHSGRPSRSHWVAGAASTQLSTRAASTADSVDTSAKIRTVNNNNNSSNNNKHVNASGEVKWLTNNACRPENGCRTEKQRPLTEVTACHTNGAPAGSARAVQYNECGNSSSSSSSHCADTGPIRKRVCLDRRLPTRSDTGQMQTHTDGADTCLSQDNVRHVLLCQQHPLPSHSSPLPAVSDSNTNCTDPARQVMCARVSAPASAHSPFVGNTDCPPAPVAQSGSATGTARQSNSPATGSRHCDVSTPAATPTRPHRRRQVSLLLLNFVVTCHRESLLPPQLPPYPPSTLHYWRRAHSLLPAELRSRPARHWHRHFVQHVLPQHTAGDAVLRQLCGELDDSRGSCVTLCDNDEVGCTVSSGVVAETPSRWRLGGAVTASVSANISTTASSYTAIATRTSSGAASSDADKIRSSLAGQSTSACTEHRGLVPLLGRAPSRLAQHLCLLDPCWTVL